MTLRPLALLVMTDAASAEALARALHGSGFESSVVSDAQTALRIARARLPDVVACEPAEVNAPVDLRHELAADSATVDIPVIVVSPRRRDDRLELVVHPGTDSAYATDARQFARLAIELARPRIACTSGEVYRARRLLVDTAAHRVFVAGEEVNVTAIEFRLLVALVSAAGRVLTRERLLRDVWGIRAHGDSRTVDTHVKRLRRKLGVARAAVETVRMAGYRFRETAPERAGGEGSGHAGAKVPRNGA